MRVREIRRRIAGDPFLKIGLAAMALALAFAAVVGLFRVPGEAAAGGGGEVPPAEATSGPLVRSDPGVEPWQEEEIAAPQTDEAYGSPQPEATQLESGPPETSRCRRTGIPSRRKTRSPTNQPRPLPAPAGRHHVPHRPLPRPQERPRHGLRHHQRPEQGLVHLPDTSLPWSDTPERNVYLAGHRLGWPGTGSHLIFYRLDELTGGERITLRDRDGTKYDYRVLESFAVWPDETG